MTEEKVKLVVDRWNWMVKERLNTDKSVNQIWREADIKFEGWK